GRHQSNQSRAFGPRRPSAPPSRRQTSDVRRQTSDFRRKTPTPTLHPPRPGADNARPRPSADREPRARRHSPRPPVRLLLLVLRPVGFIASVLADFSQSPAFQRQRERPAARQSEEHTSELQSRENLVCR